MPHRLKHPITAQLMRGGAVIGTYQADVTVWQPAAELNLGANPGYRLQVWKLFCFVSPGPPVAMDDDLVVADGTYNVAFVNSYPQTLQVVGWKYDYSLLINVLDHSGATVLPNWPAVIDPAESQGGETQDPGMATAKGPIDGWLYCGDNPAIQQGRRVRIVSIRGGAPAAHEVHPYLVETRSNVYAFGKFLKCGLSEQNS